MEDEMVREAEIVEESVDRPVGELPAAAAVGDRDILLIEQNGIAKRVSAATLKEWLSPGAEDFGLVQDAATGYVYPTFRGIPSSHGVLLTGGGSTSGHTVRFYNGSTLLQTVKNVPDGGSAEYTGSEPVSPNGSPDSYPFEGWNPAPTNIHGDTYCFAVFGKPVEIVEITDTWDDILASIDDGTYRDRYRVGNYIAVREYGVGGSQGRKNYFQIVAFDADVLADGTGKAPITFLSKLALRGTRTDSEYVPWEESRERALILSQGVSAFPTVGLPDNVVDRIVSVVKHQWMYRLLNPLEKYDVLNDTEDVFWTPSVEELINPKLYGRLYKTQESRTDFDGMVLRDSSIVDFVSSRVGINKNGAFDEALFFDSRWCNCGFCLGRL